MSDEMREKVAEIVTDAAISYEPGEVDDEFDHWSAVGLYAAVRIIPLFTAELERVELERDEPKGENIDLIGATGRVPSISKHRAGNLAHIREVIEKLDGLGLREEADTIVWQVWWSALDRQREEFLVGDANERLLDALARATAAEARLASAVGVIGILAGFAEALAEADLDELAADGGVTVGMVFQQQARDVIARRARTFMEQQG